MEFSIDHSKLLDFVRVSEKTLGVPDVVNIYTDDSGKLYLYCYTDGGFSYLTINDIEGSISTAVEAEKFFSLVKSLYDGPILFNYSKRKLAITKDNIEAKLVSSSRVLTAPTVPAYILCGTSAQGLLQALKRASSIVQDDSRFYGVLVDNSQPFCRVCNFSTSAITVNTLDFISEIPSGRFSVTSQTVSAIGSLESQIHSLFLSENKNHFGFQSSKGTVVYLPTVMDSYPVNYFEQLKLSNSDSPLNKNGFLTANFDKAQLLSAANLVSSIIGAEEASLKFNVKGVSSEGNAIWRISSRSFTQSEVQEVIEALPGSSIEEISFTVNKKQFLKVLGQLNETVSILCSKEYSALVFYNTEGRDLVLLVKMI